MHSFKNMSSLKFLTQRFSQKSTPSKMLSFALFERLAVPHGIIKAHTPDMPCIDYP